MTFLGILITFWKQMYHQHVSNAVLDVCAKSVPVRGKSGEMRGLDMSFSATKDILFLTGR